MENKYHNYKEENIVRKGEIACLQAVSPFSHSVSHSFISLVCQNAVLCGNGLRQGPKISRKVTHPG